jgi:WD40 repeat protein
VKLLELNTGRELASASFAEEKKRFSIKGVAPDGNVVAVCFGGVEGAPLEIRFLDGKTLEERGKVVGNGDPKGYGWFYGIFTPDGKRFIALDGVGNALVWDVSGQKLERTLPTGADQTTWALAISPDGKTVAVGWQPKGDPELEDQLEPDPRDVPQPRVSIIRLDGSAAPRILVAPHGYVGALAFSPDGKTLAFGGSGAVHLFDLTK